LVILDAVPIIEAPERTNSKFAEAWWHWFFFNQSETPERAILADPDAWYPASAATMGAENYADFRRAVHDPATIHGMMEDYRAGLGIDRQHDQQDREAGRKVQCPMAVFWSLGDDLADLYGDVLAVWRPWAVDLRGEGVESGHHVAEEAPEALVRKRRALL
jgi:haloacetate dehalogenase